MKNEEAALIELGYVAMQRRLQETRATNLVRELSSLREQNRQLKKMVGGLQRRVSELEREIKSEMPDAVRLAREGK